MPRHPSILKFAPQEIARLYLAGRSLPDVATELGTTSGIVHNVLVKLGVPRRSVGRPAGRLSPGKITLEQRAELYEDLRSGRFAHMGKIADKYGLSRERVRQFAAKAGVITYTHSVRRVSTENRTRAARAARLSAKEARRKLVAEMWLAGATAAEVGRAIGKSGSSVAGMIAYYRTQFPADFPVRHLKSNPEEVRERERAAVAAKRAALAAQTVREEYDRMARLVTAGLLRIGVSPAEIAGFFGINRDAMDTRISRYRKRNPEGFPPARKSPASRP